MSWKDMSYYQQVAHVLNSKKVREEGEEDHTNDIIVGNTPEYLRRYGFKNLPMLYTKRHLLSCVNKQSFRTGTKHEISRDTMMKIPEAIKHPMAVFRSSKDDEKIDYNTIIILTNLLDENKAPIIISIKKNGTGWVDDKQIGANFITSIYGKDTSFDKFIDKAVKTNRMLYYDKKQTYNVIKKSSVPVPRSAMTQSVIRAVKADKAKYNKEKADIENKVKLIEETTEAENTEKEIDDYDRD